MTKSIWISILFSLALALGASTQAFAQSAAQPSTAQQQSSEAQQSSQQHTREAPENDRQAENRPTADSSGQALTRAQKET